MIRPAIAAIFVLGAALIGHPARGQVPESLADSARGELDRALAGAWKYRPGDDPSWASPDLDDRSWPTAPTLLAPGDPTWAGWDGRGWFRFPFTAPPALEGVPLALVMRQAGSSAIYVDGELAGELDGSDEPVIVVLAPGREHVLAVRYRLGSVGRLHRGGLPAGFRLGLEDPASELDRRTRRLRALKGLQMFFTALPLALGLVHFVLFLHLPSRRANFYYALLLLCWAANPYFDYRANLAPDFSRLLTSLEIHRVLLVLQAILGLRFVYAVFYPRLPRRFWLFALLVLAAGLVAVPRPVSHFHFLIYGQLVLFAEMVRVLVGAIRARFENAWLFAVGFAVLFLFGSYDALLDLGLLDPIRGVHNAYFLGYIGFFVCTSVFLARDFAGANRRLLEQERQARERETELRILAAEDRRKTEELEAARALQLSMLPRDLPELPQLEIAVDMRTATEVGGDTYDFHLADDGTLTVVVGDATGHGMEAGTLVAAVKSLFAALGGALEPARFLERASEIVRGMNLGRLLMAMTVVRIRGRELRAATAGTPPALLYRADTGAVEEVHAGGLPLGSRLAHQYREVRRELAAGDVVLLATDGFPELADEAGEMLGYKALARRFREAASKAPREIIEDLHRAGEAWRGGAPQNDDITFAVLKVRGISRAHGPATSVGPRLRHPKEAFVWRRKGSGFKAWSIM